MRRILLLVFTVFICISANAQVRDVLTESITYYDTVCDNQLPITWFVPFNEAGIQTIVGPDSVVYTLILTTTPTYEVFDTITICSSKLPYTWNGFEFTQAGTQTVTLPTEDGCDSIVTMTLITLPTAEYTDHKTICASVLPYTWDGVEFTQADTQTVTHQTIQGNCMKVTMILSVNPVYSISDEKFICASELPYTWNGMEFTQAGTQTVTLPTEDGCDSIVTMTLETLPVFNVLDTVTICYSQLPYTWNGLTFTEAGTQTVTLQTVNGCDSVVTMSLTVLSQHKFFYYKTVCASELPYTWNGVEFTQAGIKYDTLYSANENGCDTVVKMTLYVNQPVQMETVDDWMVCSGDSVIADVFQTNARGSGSVVYTWLNSNVTLGLGDTVGTGNLPYFKAENNSTEPDSMIITVIPTYVNNGARCMGDSMSFTITVNPHVQMLPVDDRVVCHGNVIEAVEYDVYANGADSVTYRWENSNLAIGLAGSEGSGNLPSFQAVNEGTSPNNTTITVFPTYFKNEMACVGDSMNFAIMVNPHVQMLPVDDRVVCNDNLIDAVEFDIYADGADSVTYKWKNSNCDIVLTGSEGTGNFPSFLAVNDSTFPNSTTITVIPTYFKNEVGCMGDSMSFTITVNPHVQMVPVDDRVVCNGSLIDAVAFDINADGADSVNYRWKNSNIAIGHAGSEGTGNLPSFQAANDSMFPNSTTITVFPTYFKNEMGCVGDSMSFSITVNPTVQMDIISDQVVCTGDMIETAVFGTNAMGADTVTYSWTNSNTETGLSSAMGTGNLPAFQTENNGSAPVSTTITVNPVYTYRGVGCEGTPMSFDITVNPTARVNDIGGQVVCNGALTTPVAFTTDNIGGTTTFTWINDKTGIGIDTVGEGDIVAFIAENNGTDLMVANITVTPHFSNEGMSCSGPTKNFMITIYPTVVVENDISNREWCDGALTDEVYFGTDAPSVGDVTYAWTNNNTSIGLPAEGETGATTIPSFMATNGMADPITGTITVIPTYTYDSVSCNGTSAEFTIIINPKPPIHEIIGDSVFCQNQFAVYAYPVEDIAHYSYTWYLQNNSIAMNVESIPYYFSPNSLSYDTNVVVRMKVEDLATGCSSDAVRNLRICSHNSPDTTLIIRKNNSNMLLCREVSSPDGTVHYQWGYTDKATGEEMIYTWDHNYYQFDHEINTTLYRYWVETYIVYGNVVCRNRTYYLYDNPYGIGDYSDDFAVLVYRQCGQCHLRVTNPDMRHVTGGLYDISGRLLQQMDFGKAPMVEKQLNLDYAHGVYVLLLNADGKRYTTKIAW